MTEIDRRSAALLALLGPFAASAARTSARAEAPVVRPIGAPDGRAESPPSRVRHDDIAMLVYPGMTALDLIGPQYMFASLVGATVHLAAKSLAPVATDTGVVLTPTTTLALCPADLTVLFAPGGTDGTLAAMEDAETRAFVADRGSRATYVTSVCTGSLILGAAGLLKGYRATSHWAVRDVLADFGALPTADRVVRDRNRITGAGVTAGLDFGLLMVAELRGVDYARVVQLGCEYDPCPPFAAGSADTAPAETRSAARGLLSGFVGEARRLAGRLKV